MKQYKSFRIRAAVLIGLVVLARVLVWSLWRKPYYPLGDLQASQVEMVRIGEETLTDVDGEKLAELLRECKGQKSLSQVNSFPLEGTVQIDLAEETRHIVMVPGGEAWMYDSDNGSVRILLQGTDTVMNFLSESENA